MSILPQSLVNIIELRIGNTLFSLPLGILQNRAKMYGVGSKRQLQLTLFRSGPGLDREHIRHIRGHYPNQQG